MDTHRPLSRREVREIDRLAVERVGMCSLVLMENAGRQVADAVEQLLGGAGGKSVAVVAGAGNNGGDGFVAARHLAMRGAKVSTFLVCPESKITGDAGANLKVLRNLGHDVHALERAPEPVGMPSPPAARLDDLGRLLEGLDAVVDAIGGTGIQGPLRGEAATAVEQVNRSGRPVVAVDIPTGLDCDTGAAPSPTIRATVTVTFVARKTGFDAPGAQQYTGKVIVADIGVPADMADS